MDISRIEAISPRPIDWRKLTANEIVNFEKEGVDVPSEYLLWAKNFINDVDATDKDETTYEKANSTIKSSAGENKRLQMLEQTVSLRKQAEILTGDSKESISLANISSEIISNTEQVSQEEIQNLELEMKDFLVQKAEMSNKLKNEVEAVNRGDKGASLFKILELSDKLSDLGLDFKSDIATSIAKFNGYNDLLNNQTSILLDTQSFGGVTIDVGEELKSYSQNSFYLTNDYVIGQIAVDTGEEAVNKSQIVQGEQSEVEDINNDNKQKAESFHTLADSVITSEDKLKSDKNNSTNVTQTESDKAATASLDMLVKAKIRKGEYVDNQLA